MAAALSEQLLSRLSDVLATHTGLYFPKERWKDMERGISAAASSFNLANTEACARHLLSKPLSQSEIEILASHLTVGETYFFRDQHTFDALEQHILPSLLQAREQHHRRLRIWCAGCCTGEEPYSIAILLDRLLPKNETWNITLLATDINPTFLRKAAEGEYGEWSFRNTPQWIKDRYFRVKRPGRFVIDPRIHQRVNFSFLNLADDSYPSLTNNTNAMDIILCRNVLMYFNSQRARTIIENFRSALLDGGWLIVSPAETSSSLFSSFTSVESRGAILYRKLNNASVKPTVDVFPATINDFNAYPLGGEENAKQEAYPPMEAIEVPLTTTEPVTHNDNTDTRLVDEQTQQLIQTARDFANQGRLDEAADWCRRAISADKLNPAHHYLLSAIQQEQGLADEAAQSLMRTLYLDPDFVIAHYALGNLRRVQGRGREAQRHFDNALAALRARPPDEMLLEADGLTAGRITEIIQYMQSTNPQANTNKL